jgi:two-component system, OmpR family, response regulator
MTEPLHVLYVDDDPDIRTIVAMALRLDPAIQVDVAESGPAALRILNAMPSPPDAIMLDVMMPGMDGPALLAEIRQFPRYRDLPVVFTTAKGRDADLARYYQAGAKGVILKPFDPVTLAETLRNTMK